MPLQEPDLDLVVGALGIDPRLAPAFVDELNSAGSALQEPGNALPGSQIVGQQNQTGGTSGTIGGAGDQDDDRLVQELLKRAKELVGYYASQMMVCIQYTHSIACMHAV